MANLEWLLCLLRVAMYWDAHACNDVTDTSTEYSIHLSYNEWRVAGCAISYCVVTSLPLCSRSFTVEVVGQGHFSGYPSHKTYTCQN